MDWKQGFSYVFFLHFIFDIQIPDEEVLFGPKQGLYPKHGRRVGIWMSWVVVYILFLLTDADLIIIHWGAFWKSTVHPLKNAGCFFG